MLVVVEVEVTLAHGLVVLEVLEVEVLVDLLLIVME
tara:strand:- start:114 stop:221 length:108 start_codon:yes stop_codon:yes gene_type:complete